MSQSSVDIVVVDDEVLLSVLAEIFEECGCSAKRVWMDWEL